MTLSQSFTAIGLILLACVVHAESQQESMSRCQSEADSKAVKGKQRDDYIKQCLSARGTAGNIEKTNTDSCVLYAAEKKLTGDAKMAFLKTCHETSAVPGEH